MAIFGPQLIFTVLIFVILTKLGRFYSLGRYILCNKLYRYLSPGSEELKKAVRNHYKNLNGKNKKLNKIFEIDDEKEEFNIPENAEIELSMSPVMPHDLYYIKYTDDFQSFVDVSLIGIFIYFVTEVYVALFRPVDEINLSVVWCSMIVLYGFMSLASIAVNYLRTEEGALLYVFAGLSFIISLIIQLADTKYFDFNLNEAFRNVSATTLNLLQSHINSTTSTINANQKSTESAHNHHATTTQKIYSKIKTYSSNELLFSLFIATMSAFIGAILFFPSFRLARLHFLSLKYSHNSRSKRFLFYSSFLLPLLVALCWIKTNITYGQSDKLDTANPTAAESTGESIKQFLSSIIKPKNQTGYFGEITKTSSKFVMDVLMSNSLKVYLIALTFIVRLSLYRHYAQSYLNLAYELATNLRKKMARITNKQYITTISSIYQYYGVVASQYVIPLFILLFLVFTLKTLGDLSWCGDWTACNNLVDSIANYVQSLKPNHSSSPNLLKHLETNHFNFSLTHDALNQIFTPMVMRSVFGYFTFWTSFIWFLISCFGLYYYQYIDRSIISE